MKSELFDLHYPCLIYYLKKNPDYGRVYTMADVSEPTEEVYGHVCDNWATLGRSATPFSEWSENVKKRELENLEVGAKAQLMMMKAGVSSDDDVENIRKIPDFVRFHLPELNEYYEQESN